MTVKDIFDQLTGIWQIGRKFGTVATGKGYAVFSQIKFNQLNYREDLVFKNSAVNNTQLVYQNYLYSYDPIYDAITKNFSDGRKFYTLEFDSKLEHATGSNLCREDAYRAQYSFWGGHKFDLTYSIMGPNKNYCIATQFLKLSS